MKNSTQKNRQYRTLLMERVEQRQLFAADAFSGQLQIAEQIHSAERFDLELEIPRIWLNDEGLVTVVGRSDADRITIEDMFVVDRITLDTSIKTELVSTFKIESSRSLERVESETLLGLSRIRVTLADVGGDVVESKVFAKSLVDDLLVYANGGNDIVTNDTNIISTVYGGEGNDSLQGGSARDRLYGQAGSDFLRGNDGHDYLAGGDGIDRMFGNAGNDSLYGGNQRDSLFGGSGDDVMVGGADDDYLSGSSGNDSLWGEDGEDSLYGGTGDDRIAGGNHNDYLSGSAGNDTLWGDDGDDDLRGGSGDDVLSGGWGDDAMSGNSGNDRMWGDAGNDVMDGHSGNDGMYGGTGNDEIEGGSGNDDLRGDSGHDTLRGQSGNDHLYGGTGNDNLYGGSGNDYLNGESGDDGLYGGSGTDSLRGSSGDDRFLVLNDVPVTFLGFTVGQTTSDTLLDKSGNDAKINFEHGEGQTFNFSGGRWSTLDDGEFTDAEIEQVDESLAELHHQVGNTKLLKRAGGGEITFQRLGPQTAGNFNVGGINSGGGLITLLDNTFSSGDDWLAQVVFHEIGHNWDNENDDWGDWKDISGWKSFFWPWQSKSGYTQSTDGGSWYLNGSTFARNYGMTNAKEDFATYFAKVMMDDNGRTFSGSGQSTNAQKEAFMDDFFASLA